jgi:hypothetical protein
MKSGSEILRQGYTAGLTDGCIRAEIKPCSIKSMQYPSCYGFSFDYIDIKSANTRN